MQESTVKSVTFKSVTVKKCVQLKVYAVKSITTVKSVTQQLKLHHS